MHLCPHQADDK